MKVKMLSFAVVFLIMCASAFGSSPSDYMVEIEPGVYELRIMVIDDATGRVGTTVAAVEIERQ